jgi:murein DD-endopeptidase MepM/ murein hydrolase activator NlpD
MHPSTPPSRLALAAAALATLLALALSPAAGAAPSIAGKRSEIAALGRQVAELDVRVGAAAAAHNLSIDRLEAARQALLITRGELRTARRDLRRSRSVLADRLVDVYVTGQPTFLQVLLTSGSIGDAYEASDVLDLAAQGDANVLSAVRDRRARLQVLEVRQAEAQAAREREEAAAQERKAELGALLDQRQDLLADARADLKRLIKEEKERKARLAALEAARTASLNSLPYAGSGALSGALPRGDYLFPVAGPTRFSDDWLAARPGGRSHEGIDLFASAGTPIVAVADGSLYNVGYNGLGGWRLWLRDGGGTTFYFAHLSAYSPAAREGGSVSRGTVIGYVGDSGDAQGSSPHLHFEIHPGGGGPVPPYPIVTGWPRAG